MYKYFEQLQASVPNEEISNEQIADYKSKLIAEIKKLGATESDFNLVNDTIVMTSIRNNIIPEDTAWAIIQ